MNSRTFVLLLLALLLGGFALRTEAAATTDETVAFLIKHVAESRLTFIRNGSEHDAAEAAKLVAEATAVRDKAAKLMQRKYDYVKKEVRTPEDFIRLAGSGSHLSGKPYLVKMPDGKTVPSAEWLGTALREFRAGGGK